MHVTCTQTALHVHENVRALLIPLPKDNLNLQMSFFLPFTWLPLSFVHRVVILAPLLRCTDFFVCLF